MKKYGNIQVKHTNKNHTISTLALHKTYAEMIQNTGHKKNTNYLTSSYYVRLPNV